MRKKQVLIGFITGILANSLGMLLYVWLFSGFGVSETLAAAYREGFLGSLVALGAVLNLIVFFWFIKKRNDHRAKGVLAATILVALFLLFYKVFL